MTRYNWGGYPINNFLLIGLIFVLISFFGDNNWYVLILMLSGAILMIIGLILAYKDAFAEDKIYKNKKAVNTN